MVQAGGDLAEGRGMNLRSDCVVPRGEWGFYRVKNANSSEAKVGESTALSK